MTLDQYKTSLNRVALGTLGLLLAPPEILHLFAPRTALKNLAVGLHERFTDIPSDVFFGVVMLGVFLGPALLFFLLARRFWGMHCPRCQRNLTFPFPHSPKMVMRSGSCPFCQEKLFEGKTEQFRSTFARDISAKTDPRSRSAGIPAAGKEYRLPRWYLFMSIGCLVFFACMGIILDSSFSILALGPIYMICACHRERLFISPDCVRLTECFGTHEMRLADINRLVWKARPPAVVLNDSNGKMKISFGPYTSVQRKELIQFFRSAFAESAQEGWDRFGLPIR